MINPEGYHSWGIAAENNNSSATT